jgi:WD40 repeat protein
MLGKIRLAYFTRFFSCIIEVYHLYFKVIYQLNIMRIQMKHLSKTFQRSIWPLALFGLLCVMNYSVGAEPIELLFNDKITVDAKANIYGANQTIPPAPGGGGGGVLPPYIQLSMTEGQLLRFPNITGQVACANEPYLYNSADGEKFCLGYTLVQFPQNGLSGVNYQKTMFLIGVFATNVKPQSSAPPANFDSANYQTDFRPQLNQVFLIGNGRNSQNQLQSFHVPTGATHLFLGFADGDGYGQVGFYDDNIGSLTVEFEIMGLAKSAYVLAADIVAPLRSMPPQPIGHNDVVKAIIFSPDSRYVLSGSADSTLKLWEVETGAEIRTFQGHTDEILSVDFSSDGKTALSGSADNTMKLWQVDSGKEILTFQGHTAEVISVALSSDNCYALSIDRHFTFRLWDVNSGTEIHNLSDIESAVFLPDNNTLLLRNEDRLVHWDIQTKTEIRSFNTTLTNPDLDVRHFYGKVAFDGHYALSANNYSGGGKTFEVKAWDISNGAEIFSFDNIEERTSRPLGDARTGLFTFSSEGHYFLVENHFLNRMFSCSYQEYGPLELWEVNSGKKLLSFPPSHPYSPRMISTTAISPDGRYILLVYADKNMALWDINSGEKIRTFQNSIHHILNIAVSPEGNHVLSGGENGFIKLWNVNDGSEIHHFGEGIGKIISVAFSPNSLSALVGISNYIPSSNYLSNETGTSAENSLQIWDISNEPTISYPKTSSIEKVDLRIFHYKGNSSVTFSSDGRYVRLTSGITNCTRHSQTYSFTEKIWDMTMDKTFLSGSNRTSFPPVATFSPDNHFLLLSSRGFDNIGVITYKNVNDDNVVRSFQQKHTGDINSIAISSNGHYALSGSEDKSIKLWNIDNGEEIRTFQGHTEEVTSVIFSPDDRYALSGSKDNTVKLWEIKRGIELRTFQGHIDEVTSVAFSSDAHYAFSGSLDRTIKMWKTGLLTSVTLVAKLNQSTYQIGKHLHLELDINELNLDAVQSGTYDVYAAIVFPSGHFKTITPTIKLSLPGEILAYQKNVAVSEANAVVDLELPSDFAFGTYSGCGVVTLAGSDPSSQKNWTDWDCKTFQISER